MKKWYSEGIGLRVLDRLAKRFGKGWEDGTFHKGGISSGTWIVCANKTGRELRKILDLYDRETAFLAD